MNDPYMPLERRYNLTGQALAVIARACLHYVKRNSGYTIYLL